MADECEVASDLTIMFEEMCVEHARKGKVVPPRSNAEGERICLNCEAVIDESKKFCDSDCANEWEVYNKRKRGFVVYDMAT